MAPLETAMSRRSGRKGRAVLAAAAAALAGCTPPYHGALDEYVVAASASSSLDPAHAPECAFDADEATFWASAPRDGEWIEVRFDRPVRLERVAIEWGRNRATDFTVWLGSREGEWSEVGRFENALGPRDSLRPRVAVSARSFRLQGHRGLLSPGCEVRSVRFWGTTVGAPPKDNLLARSAPPGPGPEALPLPPREEVAAPAPLALAPAPPPAAPPVPSIPQPVRPARRELVPPPTVTNDETVTQYLLALAAQDPTTSEGMTDEEFLDLVAERTFGYFWWESNPSNGLTRDRGRNFESSRPNRVASIAAVGFALTAYAIGAERGWVGRDEALARVRTTLRTFEAGPVRHVRGFFPHFVDLDTGADAPGTEISTIDTALLLAGMIVAMEYFQDPEVTRRARRIFERVDWNWARHGHPHFVSHGLDARNNPIGHTWGAFNEGLLIYLLAMGSPSHRLTASSWYAIDRRRGEYRGYEFAVDPGFQSIFRYQYPALYYDFRGLRDLTGLDYFQNVAVAVLAMREYCLEQASLFPLSYQRDLWGLGAADGPGDQYKIYGFPPGEPYSPTDGTIVLYAIAGSLPFLPQHALRALRHVYDHHHEAWGKYGFTDSINPQQGFASRDLVGIDAGTTLVAIENYRSEFVWKLFMRNEWVRRASAQIGWRRLPTPKDPVGPLDLGRSASWRFWPDDGDFASPGLDDREWPAVVVPDRWENMDPAWRDLDGIAWYRATFVLEPDRVAAWRKTQRPILVTLGAVDDGDWVYLNGQRIGETAPGPDVYRQVRRYSVPTELLRAGPHVLAVRVVDTGGAGGIWNLPLDIGPAE